MREAHSSLAPGPGAGTKTARSGAAVCDEINSRLPESQKTTPYRFSQRSLSGCRVTAIHGGDKTKVGDKADRRTRRAV